MLSKAIILTISIFILSSCVTGPEGYFKRSANNKLVDRSGFKGKKRAPLYNKKYIAQAKRNVSVDDYQDDEDEDYDDDLLENENISQANRQMYRAMLEQEVEGDYFGRKNSAKNKPYPSVIRTNPRPVDREEIENLELRAELNQIKSMLNETKNEMANYRCPTAKELEKAQARLDDKTRGKNKTQEQEQKSQKPKTGDPIKSI